MNGYVLCSDARRGWWVEHAATTRVVAGPTFSLARLEAEANERGIHIEWRAA